MMRNLVAGLTMVILFASAAGMVQAQTVMQDDFDPGIDGTQWSSISESANAFCGAQAGTNSLYFSTAGTRSAETIDVDVSMGGTVNFYIKFATGAAP